MSQHDFNTSTSYQSGSNGSKESKDSNVQRQSSLRSAMKREAANDMIYVDYISYNFDRASGASRNHTLNASNDEEYTHEG